MGRKKLLRKLAEFFDLDERARIKRQQELTDLLSRLKSKEVELKQALEQETDAQSQAELKQKIELVHSQRKKGLDLLKEVRNQSENLSKRTQSS